MGFGFWVSDFGVRFYRFGFRAFGVRLSSEYSGLGLGSEYSGSDLNSEYSELDLNSEYSGLELGSEYPGLGLGSGYSGSGAPWRGQNRRSSGGRTWRLNILSLRCSNGFRLSGFGFRGSVLQVLVQSSQGHLREAKVADLQVTVRVRFYRFGFRVIRGYGDLGEAKVADFEVTVR